MEVNPLFCLDINECLEDLHNCQEQQHTVCVNINGAYRCDCEVGYQLNERICRGKAHEHLIAMSDKPIPQQ